MYNNYSFEVTKIFKNAEIIMLELNHAYVGTEHLLLSMLKVSDSINKLMTKYGLTYDDFLSELNEIVGKTKNNPGIVIYTPLLKRVIKNAQDLAKKNKVTATDLLISLLEEGEGIAIRIMLGMHLDLDSLYDELKKSGKKNKKNLEIYKIGKDLNSEVNSDLVIGRDKELNEIIETLLRKNKNNPLLIGDAGVGKSAIVEELARRINSDNVPEKLKNKRIVTLEMSSLVAGTKYRGEFEEKLNKVIKELEDNPEIILFIDEIHTISNAGGAEGAINASDILKPYLARGKIKIIGATTTSEYNKFISKDKALRRRFELIKINEPKKDETEEILSKIKPSFEHHYNIKITKENIKEIVDLTDKYILDRFNPDKSIDLLDSICAMKEVEFGKERLIKDLKEKLLQLKTKKEEMVKKNNFKEALTYRTREIELENKIENYKNKPNIITSKDIKNVLLRKENIPNLSINWSNLEDYLHKEIIGQDKQITKIVNALKNKDEDLPVSILLSGPTGVGKTETVKKVSKYLKIPLVRLDLSEYSENISISRLIGASAGYVGYDDDNIFDRIKMHPCSIILLDELEKAHPSVINLFLQILDEGYITNSKGEKIDFKNTYIFMTSNAMLNTKIGFIKNTGNLQNTFSKEFLGRISCEVYYNEVTLDMLKTYLDKKGIKDDTILTSFDYKNKGFRGLNKYIKNKEKSKQL